MRPIAALLLLAPFPLAATPATAQGSSACARSGVHTYARLADLPAEARAALALPMAERGARWQVGDVIMPGPRLPAMRFVAARRTGCLLAIRYERGGIAHTYHTAVLERRGRDWTVLRRQ